MQFVRIINWLEFSYDYVFIMTAKITSNAHELICTVLQIKKVRIDCPLSASHNEAIFLSHIINTLVEMAVFMLETLKLSRHFKRNAFKYTAKQKNIFFL